MTDRRTRRPIGLAKLAPVGAAVALIVACLLLARRHGLGPIAIHSEPAKGVAASPPQQSRNVAQHVGPTAPEDAGDAAKGSSEPPENASPPLAGASFSADGSLMVCHLLLEGGAELAVVNTRDKRLRILEGPGDHIRGGHFAGKPLRIHYFDDKLESGCSVDLDGRNRRIEIRGPIDSYSVDRAGRLAVYRKSKGERYELWCLDLRTRWKHLLAHGRYVYYHAAIDPAGRRVYFVEVGEGRDGPLFSIRPNGTGRKRMLPKLTPWFGGVSTSADGRFLFVSYYGDRYRDKPIYMLRPDGSGWRRLSVPPDAFDNGADMDPKTGLIWLSQMTPWYQFVTVKPDGSERKVIDASKYFESDW